MAARGSTLTARIQGDVAYVKMSEARKHLSTIVDEVLAKYPRVVIEKRGKPVAVISPPDDVKDVVVTEEF